LIGKPTDLGPASPGVYAVVFHKKSSTLDELNRSGVLFLQLSVAAVQFFGEFFLADFRLERRYAVPDVFKVQLAVYLAVEDLHLGKFEMGEIFRERIRGGELGTQSIAYRQHFSGLLLDPNP
jgi:hypothetical protein